METLSFHGTRGPGSPFITNPTTLTFPLSSSSRKVCPLCLQAFPEVFGSCPIHGVPLALPVAKVVVAGQPIVIAERYEIGRVLGEGGMAKVFLARDLTTGAKVAVKVLNRAYATDKRERERFLRESRTIGRIEHPNVVRLLDTADAPDGAPVLVMERLREIGRAHV